MRLLSLLLCFSLLLSAAVHAQVSISTPAEAPAPSAMLEVKSSNKGLLVPRVALNAETDNSPIASPAVSLMVYNTAVSGSGPDGVRPGYYYWTGSRWSRLSGYPVAVNESKSGSSELIAPAAGCSRNGPTLMSLRANTPIPDNDSTGIRDTIRFSGYSGNLCDVAVEVRLDHTFAGDIDLYLVAPDGTTVELCTDNGFSGDNFGTGTDLGSYLYTGFVSGTEFPLITSGTPPFTGFYRPEGSFSVLAGKPLNGDWVLRVVDDAAQDTGKLLKWKLTLYPYNNNNYVLEREVPVSIRPGMQYLALADYTAACRSQDGIETHIAWSSSSAGAIGTESVGAPANILHSSAAAPVLSNADKFVHLHNQALLSSAPPGSTVYFQLWRRYEVHPSRVNSSLIVQAIQQ